MIEHPDKYKIREVLSDLVGSPCLIFDFKEEADLYATKLNKECGDEVYTVYLVEVGIVKDEGIG